MSEQQKIRKKNTKFKVGDLVTFCKLRCSENLDKNTFGNIHQWVDEALQCSRVFMIIELLKDKEYGDVPYQMWWMIDPVDNQTIWGSSQLMKEI